MGSNVVRGILEAGETTRVLALDLEPEWARLSEYLEPHADRVDAGVLDVTRPGDLAAVDPNGEVTHVVHAAAVAHVPEWERSDPKRFLKVNVTGAAHVLDWARSRPGLRRFVHVSSGGVYGDPTPQHPSGPQPEEGPFNPPEVYAISKLAGEQVARRYGQLYGLDVVVVRLSAVFGAMERPTTGRTLMSMPYLMARALGRGESLSLTPRTLDAAGDWLSAVDVGRAVCDLMFNLSGANGRSFNIAFGRLVGVRELIDSARQAAPDLELATGGDAATASIDMDPALRRARWNAYSIDRLTEATGWSPRPLATQLGEYFRWALEAPASRCP